jgi:hypothetical protein
MTRTTYWIFGILLIGISQCLSARTAMPATLTVLPVVDALHAAGLHATSQEVEFVGSVSSSDPAVAVRVTGWKKLNAGTVWVRLMCRRAQDCLPFFILLHSSDQAGIPSFSPAPDSEIRSAPSKRTHAPALIRAGSRATLLLESGQSRIRTSVICLDSGERGSRIRVRNLATKRIIAAEIVDRGLVQARY